MATACSHSRNSGSDASGSAPRLPPSASKELQNIGGIDVGAQAGGFGLHLFNRRECILVTCLCFPPSPSSSSFGGSFSVWCWVVAEEGKGPLPGLSWDPGGQQVQAQSLGDAFLSATVPPASSRGWELSPRPQATHRLALLGLFGV